MFEEYLQDSYEFLVAAERFAKASKPREARRHFRASVFYAASAMEAFVNYIADSFAKASSIPAHEILFLSDLKLAFSRSKGFVEQPEYHRLDDKLRILINKFVPDFDFNCLAWNKFMEFKDLRDSLVHPREVDDERGLGDYEARVRAGLKAIIEVMNQILVGMSGKPLRKQMLDLIPE